MTEHEACVLVEDLVRYYYFRLDGPETFDATEILHQAREETDHDLVDAIVLLGVERAQGVCEAWHAQNGSLCD